MTVESAIEKRTEPRRDRLKLVDPVLEQTPAPVEARKPDEERAPAPQAGDKPAPRRRGARRIALILVGGTALAAGLWFGLDWWRNGRFIVSTDDAYVGAEMATVSAKLLKDVKGEKTRAVFFRRHKDSMTTKGHRQRYHRVEITGIAAG